MNVILQLSTLGSNALAYALPFLFVLTLVVFFHELGHFLVARWCGIRIETFSIGFGREIFGWNDRHGTRWKVSWIPLGGYVKFFGDENAASAPMSEDKVASYGAAERAAMFQSQPVLNRFLVVLAGPLANFLLAVAIFTLLFMTVGRPISEPRVGGVLPETPAAMAGFRMGDLIKQIDGHEVETFSELQRLVVTSNGRELNVMVRRGDETLALLVRPRKEDDKDDSGRVKGQHWVLGLQPVAEPRLDAVEKDSPAQIAGLMPGDTIREIDGHPIASFYDVQHLVNASDGHPLKLVVHRGDGDVTVTVTPRQQEDKDRNGQVKGTRWILGVAPVSSMHRERYAPPLAFVHGMRETWFITDRTLTFIRDLATGQASAEELGGPLRIAEASGEAAGLGFAALISLVAILSISIGLLNLMPIPLLDGGHLVFYVIEAVRGRPLSERSQEIGFRVGLALVLALMVVATWNDIARHVAS